jgi:hypothetical protein
MDGLIASINNAYGLIGVGVFMALMIFIKYTSTIKSIAKKLFNSKVDGFLYSPKSILKSKLTYWREFKISSLEMDEYGRNMIFRDLLHIKFDAFHNNLTKIEDADDFETIDRRELYTRIVTCMHNIVEEYETHAKAEGIPSIVINKYKKWHSSSMDYTLKSAELISQSPIYKTNYDIMNAVYLLNISLLELTIAEAERTLSKLNGELTGIVYKGYTIG